MELEKLLNEPIVVLNELKDHISEIENYAIAHEYKFYIINDKIENKDDLLEVLYEKCDFPDYYGSNWDALNEVLRDYSHVLAKGYIFGMLNSDLIKENLNKEFDLFLDIFSDASELWKSEGVPFCLILG